MLKQTIKMALIALLLGSSVAYAGSAKSVLSKQEALSHKALNAYKRHQGIALVKQIQSIKIQNRQLRQKVRDPEIKNLLVFLDICLDEMSITLKKPYSRDNAQLVADLSISIKEGTHYVQRALKI